MSYEIGAFNLHSAYFLHSKRSFSVSLMVCFMSKWYQASVVPDKVKTSSAWAIEDTAKEFKHILRLPKDFISKQIKIVNQISL